MRPKVILSVVVGIALLLSFGVGVKDAKADALLFPWITKSDSVSTLVSIVNTCGIQGSFGGGIFPYRLHYEYHFKITTENNQTDPCEPQSDKIPTSKDDIITFDAACNISNGTALFNDASPYGGASFCMNEAGPRRAFLLIDNNTPQFVLDGVNVDGTLYGEAIVMEIGTGAAWGYVAYNASGGQYSSQGGTVTFWDGQDLLGEVLNGRPVNTPIPTAPIEWGAMALMPPNTMMTKLFVTPIAVATTVNPNGTQRIDNANVRVQLSIQDSITGLFEDGIYDNNENPLDGTPNKNIVCTSADKLSSLIQTGNYNAWASTGEQGWTYVVTSPGTIDVAPFDLLPDNPTPQACVGKLEYTEGPISIGNQAIGAVMNNFIWIRNSGTVAGMTGINNLHNEATEPTP
jgi:hypothetical protein